MHRALQMVEIIESIVDQIDADRHDSRGCLRAMALTCRAFFYPAVSRLWRCHNITDPPRRPTLVTCLINMLEKGYPRKRKVVSRTVDAQRWARFEMYTSMLREVTVVPTHDLQSESRRVEDFEYLLHTVERCRPQPKQTAVIFPNVRYLHVLVLPNTVELIRPFLGPELLDLRIVVGGGKHRVYSWIARPKNWLVQLVDIFSLLLRQAPDLRRLELGLESHGVDRCTFMDASQTHLHMSSILENTLCLKRLSRLSMELRLGISYVDRLAALPYLTHLSVRDWPESNVRPAYPVDAPTLFALESLKLSSENHHSLTRILTAPLPRLSSLVLCVNPNNITSIPGLMVSVGQHLRLLTTLHIEVDRSASRLGTAKSIPWNSFATLSQCCHIEDFSLSVPVHIWPITAFDDDTLFFLANAWPSLRKLLLSGDSNEISSPSESQMMTLAGIASLVSHCPRIEEICLTWVDGRRVPPTLKNTESVVRSIGLSVRDGPIRSSQAVAAFLHSLSVTLLECNDWSRPSMPKSLGGHASYISFAGVNTRWREVMLILQELDQSRANDAL